MKRAFRSTPLKFWLRGIIYSVRYRYLNNIKNLCLKKDLVHGRTRILYVFISYSYSIVPLNSPYYMFLVLG